MMHTLSYTVHAIQRAKQIPVYPREPIVAIPQLQLICRQALLLSTRFTPESHPPAIQWFVVAINLLSTAQIYNVCTVVRMRYTLMYLYCILLLRCVRTSSPREFRSPAIGYPVDARTELIEASEYAGLLVVIFQSVRSGCTVFINELLL